MNTEKERQEKLDRARAAQALVTRRWAKSSTEDRANVNINLNNIKYKKQTKPTTVINRATDKRESTEHGNRAIGQGCYKCIKQDCVRCACYCHSA